MSDDPARWKDDDAAPRDVRRLLERAPVERAIPIDVRARIARALDGAPGLHPSGGPRTGAPAPVWKLLAAVGAVAALGVGAYVALRPSWREGMPSSSSAAPSIVVAPRDDPGSVNASPPPNPAPAREPEASHDAGARASPPSSSTHARPRSAGGDRAPAGSDLAAESELVGRARAAVAREPARAITVLDEHAALFPRGELASEREYLRIGALRRLGRVAEASARAKSFLERYPTSPYAASVRSSLADGDAR